MGISQAGKKKRKASGGRRRTSRGKRKYELGGLPTMTVITEKEKDLRKKVPSYGTYPKVKLKKASKANVYDPNTKKYQVVKLLTERENPANRNYARMNIITKGSIINTEIGTIRVTSRPGQHGVVNAVLIEKSEKKS